MAQAETEKKRYRINLHMHTTDSDGMKSPEEACEIYKAAGYDAVAITDHWRWGEEREIAGLKVFSGCEYNFGKNDTTGAVYHILGLFCTRDPGVTRKDTPSSCVRKIHKAEGLAILAHPAWSVDQPDRVQQLQKRVGFDATEIFNTVSGEENSSRPYSGAFVDQIASRGVLYPLFSADDVHYYKSDACSGAIVAELPELSREALIEAIGNGDFYAVSGGLGAPEVSVTPTETGVRITSSPVSRVEIFSNLAWARGRHHVGEGITEILYDWHENEHFLRVEIEDAEGRMAYSNFVRRPENA